MKKLIAFLLLLSTAASAQELKTKPNWHNLDYKENGVRGISTEKAYRDLLKGRKPSPVIVGVIDSGVDIAHEDLKDNLWINKGEIPGNGIDDDKNGFVDDVYGWDFLGNAQGEDIAAEQLESVRLYNVLKAKFGENPSSKKIKKNKKDYELMGKLKAEIEKERAEAQQYLPMMQNMVASTEEAEKILKEATKSDKLTTEIVKNIDAQNLDRKGRMARELWLNAQQYGGLDEFKRGLEYYQERVNFNLNPDFNPRPKVGDNPSELQYGKYGNAEVTGPDAMHGTHVAGVIGANRNNNLGVLGVADNVQIMSLRAVPSGDERDKDVANAIRYAVDNGAQIINMSFGKPYSPEKHWVDDAVKYAESKGVLLVSAAGNDSQDIDEHTQYPSRITKSGKEFPNWISVGALSYEDGEDMVASFSNYGKKGVDVFAPGVAIYNAVPGSSYKEQDGTSFASPVVAGLAALLKSYFPSLTAVQLKEIILKSAVRIENQKVNVGEDKTKADFTELSVTGGVANAYEAVKLAIELTSK